MHVPWNLDRPWSFSVRSWDAPRILHSSNRIWLSTWQNLRGGLKLLRLFHTAHVGLDYFNMPVLQHACDGVLNQLGWLHKQATCRRSRDHDPGEHEGLLCKILEACEGTSYGFINNRQYCPLSILESARTHPRNAPAQTCQSPRTIVSRCVSKGNNRISISICMMACKASAHCV